MRRYLIVSASMGAGHDHAARELARRLSLTGAKTQVVDLLRLLPDGIGPLLRSSYSGMLRYAPWLYEGIYRTFFRGHAHLQPSVSPLTKLAEVPLLREVDAFQADEVVSTFHIAAELAGRLRASGALRIPSTVLVVDMAPHDMWLHPGNDTYLCLHESAAQRARARTGRHAEVISPMMTPDFLEAALDRTALRRQLGLRPDASVVTITTGSWGTGDPLATIRLVASSGRHVPVALCGANGRLRRRLEHAGIPTSIALGWRDDMATVLAGSDVVIENAGGQLAYEAMAVGTPVIVFHPIPGHGRDCAKALQAAGVVVYPKTPAQLLSAVSELTESDSVLRQRLLSAGAGLFTAPSLPSGARPVARAAPGFPGVISGESPCERITQAQEVAR